MTMQYILLITERDKYLDMISKIQGYKMNFYKNKENKANF